MKTDTEKILEKILLPLNSHWEVSSVDTDSDREEIFVNLRYKLDYIEDCGVCYRIYDRRKERKWRHLDLWQYKTYLVAQIPRYKDNQGFFKSLEVPWADDYERLTTLLEKKQ
jgi:transposase